MWCVDKLLGTQPQSFTLTLSLLKNLIQYNSVVNALRMRIIVVGNAPRMHIIVVVAQAHCSRSRRNREGAMCRVRLSEAMSRPYPVEKEVKQGSELSPALFFCNEFSTVRLQ